MKIIRNNLLFINFGCVFRLAIAPVVTAFDRMHLSQVSNKEGGMLAASSEGISISRMGSPGPEPIGHQTQATTPDFGNCRPCCLVWGSFALGALLPYIVDVAPQPVETLHKPR